MEQSVPSPAQYATGDAYSNPTARLGWGSNNMAQNGYYSVDRISLDYMLLLSLYRGSWIIRNVVDVLAEDMLKSFPSLNCEVTPEEISDFERVVSRTATEHKMLEALKWGRLFGGAIAIICIEGDKDWSIPLSVDDVTPGSYKGLLVLDRWSGVNPSSKLISDLNNPSDYGLPEYYQCTTEVGQNFTVHYSRVLRFTGRDLPLFERQIQTYWGMSEAEVVFEELKKRDYTSWSIASLISRAQVMVLKEPMLAQAMSGISLTAQQYSDYVSRIQAISDTMSNQGLIALGEGGELQATQYSFGGLADIVSNQMLDICGACQIPVTKMFGRSVTGLGQTGDGDLQNYDNLVDQKRKRELRPQMHKLFPIIAMSTWGYVPEDLDFTFPSIREQSSAEKRESGTKITEAVLSVLNSQVPLISPRIAAMELKQASGDTMLFSNLTDEFIQTLSDKLPEGLSDLAMPSAGEEEDIAGDDPLQHHAKGTTGDGHAETHS